MVAISHDTGDKNDHEKKMIPRENLTHPPDPFTKF